MEFQITNLQKSINDIMRTLGYMSSYFQKNGEFSMVKKISRNDYPRFHLYIKEMDNPLSPAISSLQIKEKNYIFSLHLDQKKPSYKGARGHSGEYDSEVVEEEASRIKSLLME